MTNESNIFYVSVTLFLVIGPPHRYVIYVYPFSMCSSEFISVPGCGVATLQPSVTFHDVSYIPHLVTQRSYWMSSRICHT